MIGFSIYKYYISSNQHNETVNILGIFLYELNDMTEYFAHKKINIYFLKDFITQF